MSRMIKCNTFLSPLKQPLEYGGMYSCMRTKFSTSSTKFSTTTFSTSRQSSAVKTGIFDRATESQPKRARNP
jgi:hypothetical protein